MKRDELQQRLDDMFPNGVRVTVGPDQHDPIIFWASRAVMLDDTGLFLMPVFWDHGSAYDTEGAPQFSEDGTEVLFVVPGYHRTGFTEHSNFRLDNRHSPVGMEDQIAKERAGFSEPEWLDTVRRDWENDKRYQAELRAKAAQEEAESSG